MVSGQLPVQHSQLSQSRGEPTSIICFSLKLLRPLYRPDWMSLHWAKKKRLPMPQRQHMALAGIVQAVDNPLVSGRIAAAAAGLLARLDG